MGSREQMPAKSISVVIPAYNAEDTIGRALDSVLAQTCPAEEILVVDDGSAGCLEQAVKKYGCSVQLIRKENGGAASARNLGLEHAEGDLIAFLDADDYWEPTKLEHHARLSGDHDCLGLSCGAFVEQEPGAARKVVPRSIQTVR